MEACFLLKIKSLITLPSGLQEVKKYELIGGNLEKFAPRNHVKNLDLFEVCN